MQRQTLALLTVVAVSLSANCAALAADLPRKAAPYIAPPAAAFTWTGLYGGLHAGYGWSNSTATAAVISPAGVFDPAALDQNGNGFVGGGQIGYNWQFAPNFVVGIEGDFSGTGIRNTTFSPLIISGGGGPFGLGANYMAERDIKWLATVRGRLGYAADRWLLYVTGGAAWAEADYTMGPNLVATFNPVSFSHTSSGWTVGGGVEYGLSNNWSARVEYLYYDLDGVTGTNTGVAPFVATQTWDRNKINVVRVGVNYKLW